MERSAGLASGLLMGSEVAEVAEDEPDIVVLVCFILL